MDKEVREGGGERGFEAQGAVREILRGENTHGVLGEWKSLTVAVCTVGEDNWQDMRLGREAQPRASCHAEEV